MLHGVFRTKEGKLIAAILGISIIIIYVFGFTSKTDSNQYMEQAVMAENYLKAGDYEQAIEAYVKALSMKDSNQELLSIGLADSYIGINEYDKALEVLRNCYQKTSGIKIKEKIEEVTSVKTEYEYLQSISRADIYYQNKDYDKAIAEYEKAKLIKSKEVTSYQKIAAAYIEKEEYDQAREEVLEGQALTQSKELEELLIQVEAYILKEEYVAMIEKAKEYILQENYDDGIDEYRKAIVMLPLEPAAYLGLAEVYIHQEKYSYAVIILKDALTLMKDKEIEDLYEKAVKLKGVKDERKKTLATLYKAFEDFEPEQVLSIVDSSFFQEHMVTETPIYYKTVEGEIATGVGMIIYDNNSIYFGEIKNNDMVGKGIYFMRTRTKQGVGYYFYEGEWYNGLPNGEGKTEEVNQLVNDVKKAYTSKIITVGGYHKGLENDEMTKYFYEDGKKTGTVSYTAHNGIPYPFTDSEGQMIPSKEEDTYAIGLIYKGDKETDQYYRIALKTIWGVKPFIESQ
jgi:tetratricopeptide (TPR) repeat protein